MNISCPYGDWNSKKEWSRKYKIKIFLGHFRMCHLVLLFHPIRSVRHFFYFLERLARWMPIIWGDVDFDWSSIYKILELKFRYMSKHFADYGLTVSSPKIAKELKMAAALCRRIESEDYSAEPPNIGPWIDNKRRDFNSKQQNFMHFYGDYMIEQDLAYLHKLLTRKVRCWWD